MPATCPPKNNSCSISGSGPSGNCSGSASSACDPECGARSCVETFSPPIVATVPLSFCKCGRYVLPSVLLTNSTQTAAFASAGASVYVSSDPIAFAANGISQAIEVLVNKQAESGVVVDLSELSSYADGLYKVQTKGSSTGALTLASFTVFDSGAAGHVGKLAHADFPHSIDANKLVHKPRVVVNNQSVFPAYVTAGGSATECPKIEGVSQQIGARSQERLVLEYDPVAKQWCILDSSC